MTTPTQLIALIVYILYYIYLLYRIVENLIYKKRFFFHYKVYCGVYFLKKGESSKRYYH